MAKKFKFTLSRRNRLFDGKFSENLPLEEKLQTIIRYTPTSRSWVEDGLFLKWEVVKDKPVSMKPGDVLSIEYGIDAYFAGVKDVHKTLRFYLDRLASYDSPFKAELIHVRLALLGPDKQLPAVVPKLLTPPRQSNPPASNWEIEKIIGRIQGALAEGVSSLDFKQVAAFLDTLQEPGGSRVADEYFKRSTGWQTDYERKAVQKRLDAFVLSELGAAKATAKQKGQPRKKTKKEREALGSFGDLADATMQTK
jgi:hypothetical protein